MVECYGFNYLVVNINRKLLQADTDNSNLCTGAESWCQRIEEQQEGGR